MLDYGNPNYRVIKNITLFKESERAARHLVGARVWAARPMIRDIAVGGKDRIMRAEVAPMKDKTGKETEWRPQVIGRVNAISTADKVESDSMG